MILLDLIGPKGIVSAGLESRQPNPLGTVLGLIVLSANTVSELGLVGGTALGATAGIAIGIWRRHTRKKHSS